MTEAVKRRSGRPRKAEADKVQYQRIAIYEKDYLRLVAKLQKRNEGKPKREQTKLTDAMTKMVDNYCK